MVIKKLILVFPIPHNLQAQLPADAEFIAVNYNDIENTIDLYYKTNPDITKDRIRHLRIISCGTENTIGTTAIHIGSVFTKDKGENFVFDYHVFEALV
jgi:hypothetical protein